MADTPNPSQRKILRSRRLALLASAAGLGAIVIAGPAPLHYADFVATVCRAAGVRVPPVLPVPLAPLLLLSPLTRLLPRLPTVRAAELRRLTEDKAFGIGPMLAELGVEPMPLETGLARTFGKG